MRQKEVEQSLSWHLTFFEMTQPIINDEVALRPGQRQPQPAGQSVLVEIKWKFIWLSFQNEI